MISQLAIAASIIIYSHPLFHYLLMFLFSFSVSVFLSHSIKKLSIALPKPFIFRHSPLLSLSHILLTFSFLLYFLISFLFSDSLSLSVYLPISQRFDIYSLLSLSISHSFYFSSINISFSMFQCHPLPFSPLFSTFFNSHLHIIS